MFPDRRPAYWAIPRLFPDATIVVIGGGPSLTPADVDAVLAAGLPIVAIKDALRLAPEADVLYGCDATWWDAHMGAPLYRGRAGQPLRVLMDTEDPRQARTLARWPDLRLVGQGPLTGLSADPTRLARGHNSGYQGINLAVLLGARHVILLGFDLQRGADGRNHWFGEHHYDPAAQFIPYDLFLDAFPTLVPALLAVGVSIVNCSPVTALACFPRLPLAAALSAHAANRVENDRRCPSK